MTPEPSGTVDLSVTVVNYNSSQYLFPLLESLENDPFKVDGRRGTYRVVVVDNASPDEDHRRLEAVRGDRVSLLRNSENLGYGLANNQGFHVTRSRWHLVCNPDVRIVPGCLQTLLDTLESRPRAGVVGPLATMDLEREVLMPPNELPDPYLESLNALSRAYPQVARYNARRRSRQAWRYWTACEPMPMAMLSGGFFLGRRSTFRQHGLFDPGYPLYYEDTDLFRRLRERGMELWHVPQARIVHHFSRSTLTRQKAAMYRHRVGARRYFRGHFGEAGLRAWEAVHRRGDAPGREHECPFELEEVRAGKEPPALDAGGGRERALEVAGNPQFTLAVGIIPSSPGAYRLPDSFWEQLGPGRYWMRAVDLRTFETLKAWLLNKTPST